MKYHNHELHLIVQSLMEMKLSWLLVVGFLLSLVTFNSNHNRCKHAAASLEAGNANDVSADHIYIIEYIYMTINDQILMIFLPHNLRFR